MNTSPVARGSCLSIKETLPKADTQIPRTNDRAIKRLIVPTKRELLSTEDADVRLKKRGIWIGFLLSGRGEGEKVESKIIRLAIGD